MESEEEVYLIVELSGLPTPDMIKSCTETCTLLGMGSAEPILQLDNYMFQGTYEDTVGTAMVFKEEEQMDCYIPKDATFGRIVTFQSKELKYLCKTDKKLVMKRVVLKSKQPQQQLQPQLQQQQEQQLHEQQLQQEQQQLQEQQPLASSSNTYSSPTS